MKKTIALLLAVAMLATLTACGKADDADRSDSTTTQSIVTTSTDGGTSSTSTATTTVTRDIAVNSTIISLPSSVTLPSGSIPHLPTSTATTSTAPTTSATEAETSTTTQTPGDGNFFNDVTFAW